MLSQDFRDNPSNPGFQIDFSRRYTGPKRKSSDPWPQKDLADACIEVLISGDAENCSWRSDSDHDRDEDEYDYMAAARRKEKEDAESAAESQAQRNTLLVQMLRFVVEAVSQVINAPLPAWAAADAVQKESISKLTFETRHTSPYNFHTIFHFPNLQHITRMIPSERLPLPNTDGAPSFTGSPYEIDDFLRNFEYLSERRGILYHEMCQSVPEYTTDKVRTLWENLPEHKAGNWEAYKARILSLYPERDPEYRQSHAALMRLIRRQSKIKIKRISQFAEYNREFLWITSWRISELHMSQSQRDELFPIGLNKRLRAEAQSFLKSESTGSKHKASHPWTYKELADACVQVLKNRAAEYSSSDSDESDSGFEEDEGANEYYCEVARRKREKRKAAKREEALVDEQDNIQLIADTVTSDAAAQAQSNTLIVQMLRYLVEAVSQVTNVPLPAWAAA
ncbi:hypothetical protein SISSUDRAFT_1067202 [Sistotremastrum suecicum HHB10207 ss-3]|uniref:Uncharacterized protein n=1 Tax=Sistotremastrum suecicum HHB10207 ss-3 TaxID=1314776 RepID=A0A165XDX0_9AGAM|nr:hypothetical protein SISSUDRAFT_1067202 [Sistotremastrum suecicum HHB10207 ss-3]